MIDSALRSALAALLICASATLLAEGVGTETEERERIAAERSTAQTAFSSRERHCQNSFVVTPCVENARRDLREVLLRLRRQEAILDEMQRRERAAQRLETIRNRPAMAGPPASPAAAREARSAPHDAPRVRVHEAPTAKRSAQERQRAETLSEQKFEAASQAAGARRSAVERRNAERAAGGKGAAPLPVPSGASAP